MILTQSSRVAEKQRFMGAAFGGVWVSPERSELRKQSLEGCAAPASPLSATLRLCHSALIKSPDATLR